MYLILPAELSRGTEFVIGNEECMKKIKDMK